MKPIIKKAFVPFLSAVTGGLLVLGGLEVSEAVSARKETPQTEINWFDDFFKNDSFFQDDIFKHMDTLREEMKKNFGSSFLPVANLNEISRREDENFVYYEVKLGEVGPASIETQVEKGQVILSGTVEKKARDEESSFFSQSSYSSTFQRSFPAPENVDAMRMEMVQEKDKIVLKFPKLKAEG